MTEAITALVADKRATGYKYDTEQRVLARFAAFSAGQFPGLQVPDRASVEAWIAAAQQRGVKPATLQGLAAPVRELARWLGRRGMPGVEQMLEQLDLTDEERQALEGDREALTGLAQRLADTPTPAGPTPKQLGTDSTFIPLTALTDSLAGGRPDHIPGTGDG
jgi:hypothetical protein